jgi:hypothetical protein
VAGSVALQDGVTIFIVVAMQQVTSPLAALKRRSEDNTCSIVEQDGYCGSLRVVALILLQQDAA